MPRVLPAISRSLATWTHSSRVGTTTSACGTPLLPSAVALDALQQRHAEAEGLAGAGARLADEVLAGERDRQGHRLDGERGGDADGGERLDGLGPGAEAAKPFEGRVGRRAAIVLGGLSGRRCGRRCSVLVVSVVPLVAARAGQGARSGRSAVGRRGGDGRALRRATGRRSAHTVRDGDCRPDGGSLPAIVPAPGSARPAACRRPSRGRTRGRGPWTPRPSTCSACSRTAS